MAHPINAPDRVIRLTLAAGIAWLTLSQLPASVAPLLWLLLLPLALLAPGVLGYAPLYSRRASREAQSLPH